MRIKKISAVFHSLYGYLLLMDIISLSWNLSNGVSPQGMPPSKESH